MTAVNVISLRFPIVFKVGSRVPCPLGQLVVSNLNFPPKQSRKCRHLNAMFFSSNHRFINFLINFIYFFKVGSRGPCPLGQLVVFEKYSGKSYRGECGCSPGYNQNYWPETGQCFEWYTQGPCKDSFLFQYNRDSGKQDTF